MDIDERLQLVHGVHFFFSCITGTHTNNKSQKNEMKSVRPGISYFISFSPTTNCDANALYNIIQDAGLHPEVSTINTRSNAKGNTQPQSKEEVLQKMLGQAFKDHNNRCIKDMVTASNKYCLATACTNLNYEDRRSNTAQLTDNVMGNVYARSKLCPLPCRAVLVNARDYSRTLLAAIVRLQSDGFLVHLEYSLPDLIRSPPPPKKQVEKGIDKATRIVAIVMKKLDHVMYCGEVYSRPEHATFAYTYHRSIDKYIDELLANEAIRSDIIRHRRELKDILGKKHCAITSQIKLDFDLIEVLNGKCFQISARKFIKTPLKENQRRCISPRAFQKYDPEKLPRPKYFMSSVLNSFQEDQVRARFLNKLYQLLLSFSLPQKIRRLVTYGAKDSGKTTWLSIFLGIIPQKYIASITKEGKFATSGIKDSTMLVFIEEWTKEHLTSDVAKAVFQGGLMVTAVKSKEQRLLNNNVPFYITTNNLPDFGIEAENVNRRLAIFETRSLPRTEPGVNDWLKNNAMECIAWMASEINRNRHLIEKEELFYEKEPRTETETNNTSQHNLEKIREVSLVDNEDDPPVQRAPRDLHNCFEEAAMDLVTRLGPPTSTGEGNITALPPRLETPPVSPIAASELELSPCVIGNGKFHLYNLMS